jgi:hypothetical protein
MYGNLEDVKCGDILVDDSPGRYEPNRLVRVSAVNKATFAVEGSGNSLFNKKNGRRRGDTSVWHSVCLRRPHPGEIDSIRAARAAIAAQRAIEGFLSENKDADKFLKVADFIRSLEPPA